MAIDTFFVFTGVYRDVADALADYDAIKNKQPGVIYEITDR